MKLIKNVAGHDRYDRFIPGAAWYRLPMLGFDTETTGVDPETARVVSASLILDDPDYDPGSDLDSSSMSRTWLVNPGIDIPLEATAVHGISTDAIQSAMNTADFIDELLFMTSYWRNLYGELLPLVVFNAPYDLTLMIREMVRVKADGRYADLDNMWGNVIDPLICDRALDTYRTGRRTLSAVSAAYGVAIKGSHTADGDVRTTIGLARAMGEKYKDFGCCQMWYLQAWQKAEYSKWAKHFTEYRRRNDPDFLCEDGWPVR